jgi:iron(III) transport system ATP-binding protein
LGEVVAREFKGHDLTYRVRLLGTDREVQVQESPTAPYRVGDRVGIQVVGEGVALEGSKTPVGTD